MKTARRVVWACVAWWAFVSGGPEGAGAEEGSLMAGNQEQRIEKIREMFSLGYKEAKEQGVVLDSGTRKDLEFIDRRLQKLRDQHRQLAEMEQKLKDGGASQTQINKFREVRENVLGTIRNLPRYELGMSFLENLRHFKEPGNIRNLRERLDGIDMSIGMLRSEMPALLGDSGGGTTGAGEGLPRSDTPGGGGMANFAPSDQQRMEVMVKDIKQHTDGAEVVFFVGGQQVKPGDNVRVELKGGAKIVPIHMFVLDEWGRYLREQVAAGKMETEHDGLTFFHEQDTADGTIRSTWYPFSDFDVKAEGRGAQYVGTVSRGAYPDKRFGDPFKGNVAEVVLNHRPAQNIELVVEGKTTWRRETGRVGAKLQPQARPEGPRAMAVISFSAF